MRRFLILTAFFALLILSTFAAPVTAQDVVDKDFLDKGLPEAVRVVDLNVVAEDGNATPRHFLYDASLNMTFFSAAEHKTGAELWRTDGSEGGTQLVSDLCAGPCSSFPRPVASFDGRVYFIADDGVFGVELWSTDGTSEGTSRVRDVCPGPCPGVETTEAVVFQDRLIFTAADFDQDRLFPWQTFDRELWSTDGTREGTQRLPATEICSENPRRLTVAAGLLFFHCGDQLVATDGTELGTQVVSPVEDSPTAATDDLLFFLRETADFGVELWKSDGSTKGTEIVADLCPGSCSGAAQIEATFQERAYFIGSDTLLYRTDASAGGVELIESATKAEVFVADSQIFYQTHQNAQSEIWASNGGPNQGRRVYQGPYQPGMERFLTAVEDRLYFVAENGVWTSDGSVAGTIRLGGLPADARIYSNLFAGNLFGAVGAGRAVFSADDEQGYELWLAESDTANAQQITNISLDPGSGKPSKLSPVGDRLVFDAFDERVRSTDGTPEGTFAFDQGPTLPLKFFPYGDELLFSTIVSASNNPPVSVPGLWSTDGDEPELVVDDLRTVAEFVPLPDGNYLIEASNDDEHWRGNELWILDLANSQANFLAEISPGTGAGLPSPPIPLSARVTDPVLSGGSVIFGGGEPGSYLYGAGLWATDGSPEGTTELLGCLPEAERCLEPREMTLGRDGLVVFSAWDQEAGRELWHTDGTAQGTRRIKDLNPGPENSSPHDFTRLGPRRILFFARGSDGGEALWRTDGSARRTWKAANLSYGGAPSFVLESLAVGNRLFLVVANETTGAELWVSNGTSNGTRLVREIVEGPTGSSPQGLTALDDGRVLFAARGENAGVELWISDGTAEGTRRLTDVAPGPTSSAPEEIRVAGDRIYFVADDGESGRELWTIALADL